jgi:putative transposase
MCGVFREGVAVKYAQIEALRPEHPVAPMCRVLDVSESGYHAWRQRPPAARAQDDERLSLEIKAAHQRTRETYGPERLQVDLAEHGVTVGVNRIKRLRRAHGLRCRQRRKFVVTTDSAHDLPLAPNLLNRDFAVTAPNVAWLTDITDIPTDEGWLSRCGFKYLAGVKDVFNGEGWAMPWPSTWPRHWSRKPCFAPSLAGARRRDCCTPPIGAARAAGE